MRRDAAVVVQVILFKGMYADKKTQKYHTFFNGDYLVWLFLLTLVTSEG